MKILVLNGSPRPNGNTAALVDAFVDEAQKTGQNKQKHLYQQILRKQAK